MGKSRRPGPVERRLQPKLRMVLNGSTSVNALRSEHASALAAKSARVLRQIRTTRECRRDGAEIEGERGSIDGVASSDIEANVFITVRGDHAGDAIRGAGRREGDVIALRMTLADIEKAAEKDEVAYIELAEPVSVPWPLEGPPSARPASAKAREIPGGHGKGKNVLIGIVDVQGFDFSHVDFMDGGATRWVRIWDQGGHSEATGRDAPPAYGYGVEFTDDHFAAAIEASEETGIPAWEFERQSQIATSSHGTHVASIAAGKSSGLCSKSKIAGVLVSLPVGDQDRRLSFYDSTRVADAIKYLVDLAPTVGCDAVSINVSLGTNGHAHDGSSATSRWIDSLLTRPGRSVCVAAGNAGQEAPTSSTDQGFIMGRIHTSGRIPAAGLDRDLEWIVPGDGIVDLSENELEIWYGSQDRLRVSLRTPGGQWIGPVSPAQFIENRQLDDKSFVSIYNELYHPSNGANYIGVYLSPFLARNGIVGVPSGTWTVRLHGEKIRDGRFHGWIERDDPIPVGRVGDRDAWRFPSFFSQGTNVDQSSVSSLACGHNVISVANLDKDGERVNVTSSQGPTRDGRHKPEVAAPGTDVLAARGFAGAGRHAWVRKTGTSMASPYVAGVVGLMLATDPTLTAAQVAGIIKRTSRPLPGDDYDWRDDAGYGEIDPVECVREAARVHQNEDITE